MAAAPALTGSTSREVLRDTVIPPPDLHELPSPLTKFRDYVKNEKETVLFDVDGLPKNGRIRIAAMDNYDGVVFNVDPNSSASFAPIGDPKALSQHGPGGTDPPSALSLTATPASGSPASQWPKA